MDQDCDSFCDSPAQLLDQGVGLQYQEPCLGVAASETWTTTGQLHHDDCCAKLASLGTKPKVLIASHLFFNISSSHDYPESINQSPSFLVRARDDDEPNQLQYVYSTVQYNQAKSHFLLVLIGGESAALPDEIVKSLCDE